MKIKYKLDKGTLYIYLIGELDECSAQTARDKIDGLFTEIIGISRVIFNLYGLTFMDSTGIGMLIGRYKKLKKMKVDTFIENPTTQVEKIIEVSGLYQIMPKV
ncbi:MAG: STAS domain-containing protein [Clostridia bacterium]|nr:STAS domain-containing protein [Clostridia bacterium]